MEKEKRARRKFPDEFKSRAVELVLKQGVSIAQASRDLGINESNLANWVRQAKVDQGRGPAGALTSEELAELRQLRKEVKVLRDERDILKKSGDLLRQGKGMKFDFIEAEKVKHSVPKPCKILHVSRSGYYASRRRGPSARDVEDARLATLVVAAHRLGRGSYGSPRIFDELREQGETVGRRRVARLMKERGLLGEMKKKWRHPAGALTSDPCVPNQLDRDFAPLAPNRSWAIDITYVCTWEGWLYVAVVIDLFSRRVGPATT